MAKRKDGKLKLTHAEQALSKVMGDLIQLPRQGFPHEVYLGTDHGIRIRHIQTERPSTIWRAVLDLQTRWRPILYVNADYQRRARLPIREMLNACDAFMRRGNSPEKLWNAGEGKVYTVCAFCGRQVDSDSQGWASLIIRHVRDCWGQFRIRVAPYRNTLCFDELYNYAI